MSPDSGDFSELRAELVEFCSQVIWGLIPLLISRVRRFSEGQGWVGIHLPQPHTRPCAPAFPLNSALSTCFWKGLSPGSGLMKPVVMKSMRTTERIKVMDLMAVVVDWTVRRASVSDTARKIRVKPFCIPQTEQMPPQPPLPRYPTIESGFCFCFCFLIGG